MTDKVNLTTIATKLALKLDISQKAAAEAASSVFEIITESLVQGSQVSISNFGSFTTKKRPSRSGRNPQTGEPIEIEARTALSFKVSPKLKEIVKDV